MPGALEHQAAEQHPHPSVDRELLAIPPRDRLEAHAEQSAELRTGEAEVAPHPVEAPRRRDEARDLELRASAVGLAHAPALDLVVEEHHDRRSVDVAADA